HIFMQEGWHYEMRDAEDQPIYKGVVFNEMKGSFSSVDTMIDNEMMRMLYPDNCYQYVSGGDPEAIVTLGYEDFLAQHRRFYHPANAIFYLEGHLDIDRALAKIDAYVGTNQTPGSFAEIPSQKAIANVTKTVRYGISEDESLENKTHIIFGKIVADYDEKQKMYAISLLSDYLTGSNDAVLKKAILDQGLAQDVSAILTDGIQQAYFTLALSNTNSDQKDAITAVVKETIEGLLAEGLNRELLESSLNNLEFAIRDVNEPKALMHNIMVLNAMLYGGDPLTYLDFTDMMKDLREALKTNYYEELLAEIFDDQVGVATLIMEPSKTYNSELARQEADRLAAIKASWDQDMIQSVIADNASLDHWQHTEDTKENLDKIPRLTLADIAPQIAWTSIDEREIDGVKVLIHPSDIPEITHLNVYFKLDIPDEETLLAIGFLPNMFGDLPTKRSLNDLIYDIKGHVGRLYFDMVTTSAPGDLDHADLYLVARCSVLNSKVQDAVRLIDEIIHETDLTEKRL
ncbi:MAG: insulinase family protein, partial [bacterium]